MKFATLMLVFLANAATVIKPHAYVCPAIEPATVTAMDAYTTEEKKKNALTLKTDKADVVTYLKNLESCYTTNKFDTRDS